MTCQRCVRPSWRRCPAQEEGPCEIDSEHRIPLPKVGVAYQDLPPIALASQNLASMVLRQALAAKSEPDRRAKLQESERFARKAIEVDPTLPRY